MLGVLRCIDKPKNGRCRLNEDGEDCPDKALWRGICFRHRRLLKKSDKESWGSRFEKLALPLQSRIFNEDDYEVVKHPKKGCCRLKIRGVLCKKNIECRGLCKEHYDILRSKARGKNLLEKYSLSSKIIVNYVFNPNYREGACRILDDGSPCTRKIFGRGMCQKHWQYYLRRKLLEVFGTASRSGCYFEGKHRAKEKRYD